MAAIVTPSKKAWTSVRAKIAWKKRIISARVSKARTLENRFEGQNSASTSKQNQHGLCCAMENKLSTFFTIACHPKARYGADPTPRGMQQPSPSRCPWSAATDCAVTCRPRYRPRLPRRCETRAFVPRHPKAKQSAFDLSTRTRLRAQLIQQLEGSVFAGSRCKIKYIGKYVSHDDRTFSFTTGADKMW